MRIVSLSILLVFMLTGCFDFNKRMDITSEYIINEKWDKKKEEIAANSIEIKKMKVKKDSTINPFSDLNQADILNKLEIDSSFIYTANVKIGSEESYKDKKIYFNRDNGFYWWTDQGNHKTKILGKLEINTWYEVSRLNYYYYVIFIDSTDKTHCFIVNVANY